MFRRVVPDHAWLLGLLAVLLPIAVRSIHAFIDWPPGSLHALGTSDPDAWVRLTLVREWLAGGSWYDHHYASNGPLDPSISPWTRPLDLVIALFTKLQFDGASLSAKLIRTGLVLPLLWMGLLYGALAYAVRRIVAQPHALLMLAVLLATAPLMYNYLMPGNTDHHAVLSMLYAWSVALTLTGDWTRWRMPLLVGALQALMLWMSPEALLTIAGIYGWLGLRWLAGERILPLARTATVVALGAALAVMIERPPAQWSVFLYDSISVSQVLPLGLVALVAWALTRITGFFWLWRALAALLLLGAAAAYDHALDPLFFRGPMANADPYIHDVFLKRITEARHLFSEPRWQVVGMLAQPLLALAIAFICARRRNGIIAPRIAAGLLWFLAFGLALYIAQIRWFYYLYPLVALTLAPWLGAWFDPRHRSVSSYWPAARLQRLSEMQQVTRRMPLMLAIFLLPLTLVLCTAEPKTPHQKDTNACHEDMRTMIQRGDFGHWGEGAPKLVFAPTDLGGELLYFTPHRIIASNYHREGRAIRDVWEAQKTPSLAEVRKTLARRKVDILFLCPDENAPKDAALEKLWAGTLSAPWLVPQKVDPQHLSAHPPLIFLVR